MQEALEHRLTVRGVHDLGVVLDAGQAAGRVLEGGDRGAGGGGQGDGSRPAPRCTASPWLIQTGLLLRLARQQRAGVGDGQRGAAELARARCGRPCRRARPPWPGSRSRCRTPGRRPRTGPDRPRAHRRRRREEGPPESTIGGRVLGEHLGDRRRVRNDLGVHPGLTHPARDQLRVLGPVVHHEYRTFRRVPTCPSHHARFFHSEKLTPLSG